MGLTSRRATVALVAGGALLAPLTIAAQAAVVPSGTARSGSLVQVGPISDHGFPTWYRDSNGIRLEACWSLDDPLCQPLPDELPDPGAPVSYPGNFPGEHFFSMAGASVSAGSAGTVDVEMNLEAAWANEQVNEGDQMVFGRIRIRAREAADGRYRVVHPYGTDEFTAAGGDGIDMTEDIGIAPGAFGGALQSRVGPYLTWDTFGSTGPDAPPAGYIGDPGVEHKVKGSPYGTNSVTVQQLAADGTWQSIGFTDLFTVQGRLAVNDGVDVQQATYRTMPDGKQVVEVFATSEAGEAIKLVAPDLGYKGITLESDEYVVRTSPTSSHREGRYFGRFAVKAGVTVGNGTEITIQNAGDVPVLNKRVKLTDVVTVSQATYDGSALTVSAQSSDPTAVLTVAGFGELTGGATVVEGVDAPPPVVTVTSSKGGTVTVPLMTSGAFTLPDPPVAVVTATPSRPLVTQPVTLDMTQSLDATSHTVTVLSAPANSGVAVGQKLPVTAGKATFTPTRPGLFELSVVAVGDSGSSPVQPVSVQVLGAQAQLMARAGAAQEVQRGAKVTLDGSMSPGAASYRWEQIPNVPTQPIPADHKVTLSDPTAAKPTFTFPLMTLPSAPGPNTTYTAVNTTPLRFRLTVTGVDGTTTSVHETVVRPKVEALALTDVRYRTRGEWRVSGTSSLKAGQRVAVVLHSRTGATGLTTLTAARGPVIGFATVDTLGAWTYVGPGPNPQTSTPVGLQVTAVSAQGGSTWGAITLTP